MVIRLVQEALVNTVRHAGAAQGAGAASFPAATAASALLVLDDGVGFEKHAVLDGQPSERNVGLYGMIERTEVAGGRLHIRTRPGAGVAIRAVL